MQSVKEDPRVRTDGSDKCFAKTATICEWYVAYYALLGRLGFGCYHCERSEPAVVRSFAKVMLWSAAVLRHSLMRWALTGFFLLGHI